MEPLFRNINIKSEEKCREIYRNVYPSYHIVHLTFIIFSLALIIYWIYFYYSINLILAVYLLYVIASYIIRPFSYAKKRIKYYNSLYKNPETDEVLFYNDFFIDKDIYSKSETKIEYERITSVKTTKHYYIFSIKDCKSKFTIGKEIENLTDNNDFIAFINNKLFNSKKKIK